jgi:hypothetical protein
MLLCVLGVNMRKLGIKEAEQNKKREPSIVQQQPTSTHVFRYIFLGLRNKTDFFKKGGCWNKCLIG